MKPVIIRPNTSRFWTMQEGSGTSVSCRIGAHAGTAVNGTWVDGIVGKALRFVGTGGVTTPAAPYAETVSFRMLLKPENLSVTRYLWAQIAGGYYTTGTRLFINATHVGVESYNDYADGSDAMELTSYSAPHGRSLNQWFLLHVTISASGAARFYVNGVLVGQGNIAGNTTGGYSVTGQVGHIGGMEGFSANNFYGQISHFAIIEREMTAAECAADYFGNGGIL